VQYLLTGETTPDVILVSPLIRTLETATVLRETINANVIVVEEIREHYGQYPCDKRKSTKVLSKQFPHFDFTLLEEEDTLWTETREPQDQLHARVERMLNLLVGMPKKCICVVTHNGFLKALMDVLRQKFHLKEKEETQRNYFMNGELRTVIFENGVAKLAMAQTHSKEEEPKQQCL